jgi:hypothetical protein
MHLRSEKELFYWNYITAHDDHTSYPQNIATCHLYLAVMLFAWLPIHDAAPITPLDQPIHVCQQPSDLSYKQTPN